MQTRERARGIRAPSGREAAALYASRSKPENDNGCGFEGEGEKKLKTVRLGRITSSGAPRLTKILAPRWEGWEVVGLGGDRFLQGQAWRKQKTKKKNQELRDRTASRFCVERTNPSSRRPASCKRGGDVEEGSPAASGGTTKAI